MALAPYLPLPCPWPGREQAPCRGRASDLRGLGSHTVRGLAGAGAERTEVVHDERRARALVEEAPAAYRDVREVLEDEADLVTPLLRLEPMVVLKG